MQESKGCCVFMLNTITHRIVIHFNWVFFFIMMIDNVYKVTSGHGFMQVNQFMKHRQAL